MVSRRTGPPKNTFSPDNFLSVGRLRITPTVWASGVCVTSTTVSRKLGSVRPGLATSSTPFGRSAGCAAASMARNSSDSGVISTADMFLQDLGVEERPARRLAVHRLRKPGALVYAPRPHIFLLHLQGDLAAAELERLRLHRAQQVPREAATAVLRQDCKIVDVEKRPRKEGRESQEAGGDPRRLPMQIGEEDERRGMPPEAIDETVEGLLRKSAAFAHRVERIRRRQGQHGGSMIVPLQIGLDDVGGWTMRHPASDTWRP